MRSGDVLLQRTASDDSVALDELLARMEPRLYPFSLKVCQNKEDIEDLLQETLPSAAKNLGQFNGRSTLSTWLFTIARNQCSRQRQRGRFVPAQQESLDDVPELRSHAPSPADQAELTQRWEQVERALGKLSPEDREVLVLRDVEGFKAAEVAEVTGSSVTAVKSRLHRARARLRQHLSGSVDGRSEQCSNIREVFSLYLEGDITALVCESMQTHVGECSACANECQGLRDALDACSSAPALLPSEISTRVRTHLRRALQAPE
ncbi:MAG: RNA polymerase sigma-70 factor (ECF subfamily) [Bradymonadia bacterium]|jgi:RNA polymerase sigma-70 factor (ECF subfamily)